MSSIPVPPSINDLPPLPQGNWHLADFETQLNYPKDTFKSHMAQYHRDCVEAIDKNSASDFRGANGATILSQCALELAGKHPELHGTLWGYRESDQFFQNRGAKIAAALLSRAKS